MHVQRRVPVGAERGAEGGVHFRVWAPRRRRVEVLLDDGRATELQPEPNGYFAGHVATARVGTRYRYRLDGGDAFPDPASRFQPEGPHGPSEVVDPTAFPWSDAAWRGARLPGQVIYEMHIGTFTREGTWAAAIRELPELKEAGITVVEVMPVAEFPGRFGWGYDGVQLFAPTRLYGSPDDFRRFVDRAHALEMGVILDVVYNHLGPDGNYLGQYGKEYFSTRHATEWGEALNFDGEQSGPVRQFFVANAGYWVDEFHIDGLRLDATHRIFDDSADHVLAAIGRRVREAARGRATIVVAEDEAQRGRMARPAEKQGYALDGTWNDDFHHSAMGALTGLNDSFLGDFRGDPQELISAVKWGFLYQGQRSKQHKQRRGTPAHDWDPGAFITFLENHDQVSNLGRALRRHQQTSPGKYRAMTALLLLAPQTPMLFQGQEFAASSPFFYFADHNPDLAKLVRKGRAEFLAGFRNVATPEMQALLPDPADPATFERCKLDLTERASHAEAYRLHRDLLQLRRSDPVFAAPRPRGVDGAVLGPQALVLRFFAVDGADRLLVMNLGRALHLSPAPEPLLAPPDGKTWSILWSSEDVCYGGSGTAELDGDDNWRLPPESAVVLGPKP